MRFILLFSLFCLSISCFAGIEQIYVRRLSQARTAAEIHRLKSAFDDLNVARVACRLQLRKQQAPVACYESLQFENEWGLHPSRESRRELLARLDGLCRKAAGQLNVPKSGFAQVSAKCRSEIARARHIQEYRDRRPEWSEY